MEAILALAFEVKATSTLAYAEEVQEVQEVQLTFVSEEEKK